MMFRYCKDCQNTYQVDEIGVCPKCGKGREGYTLRQGISWTNKTNFERRVYAKDLLQPFNADGTKNEYFQKVYGNSAYKNLVNKNDPEFWEMKEKKKKLEQSKYARTKRQ